MDFFHLFCHPPAVFNEFSKNFAGMICGYSSKSFLLSVWFSVIVSDLLNILVDLIWCWYDSLIFHLIQKLTRFILYFSGKETWEVPVIFTYVFHHTTSKKPVKTDRDCQRASVWLWSWGTPAELWTWWYIYF